VIKLLTILLSLVQRVFDVWDDAKLKQAGRHEAIKDAADEVERQIDLGAAAVAVPDPERTERLRYRFDRARAD
jgi:hypothetical protein